MKGLNVIAIGLALALVPAAANAAEIKVVSTNALKSSINELAPQFEKATEHKLVIKWGTAAGLKTEIEKGEVFDVAILTTDGVDDLIKQGKLAAATRSPLARSAIGVAIRKGSPKPDIGTTEAFKRAMLDAKTITYVEQGASGIYLKGLFVKLAIADAIKSKLRLAPTAAAEFIAQGGAEIGMTQVSEILPFAGADLVGPLPADIQNYTNFSGAAGAAAKQADAAKAFVKFLASPEAAKVMKAKGLEPQS